MVMFSSPSRTAYSIEDVGGQHLAGLGADVERIVRFAGRHDEGVAGMQGERGLSLDRHSHRPGQDETDSFARVDVPARLDPRRDLGEDLDDVTAGDR